MAHGVDIPTHGGAMTLNVRKTEDGVELTLGTPLRGIATGEHRHCLAYIPLDPEGARTLARTLLEFDA